MHLSAIAELRTPFLIPPLQPGAYYLLAWAALVLIAVTIVRSRRRYLVRHWPPGGVMALAPLTLLAAYVVIGEVWPGEYAWVTAGKPLVIPLLLLVPVAAGAAYTRTIEAVLLGTLSSLGIAVWYSHNPLTVLEGAYIALFMHLLLAQPYRGRLFWTLRQPLLAVPLASLLALPLTLLAHHAVTPGPPLTALISAGYATAGAGLAALAQALIAGIALQVLYLTPLGRPVPVPSRVAPHDRSLRGKVLGAYLPVAAVALVIASAVLLYSAITTATRWALAEAARDAGGTSQRIRRVIEEGQAYLAASARDDSLAQANRRQEHLDKALALQPVFSSVVLAGAGGEAIAAAPPTSDPSLTEQERATVADLPMQAATLTPPQRLPEGAVISLISPIGGGGRLIGRMNPAAAPVWQDIVADVQWTIDAGNGFIIDEQRRIIAHPDAKRLLTVWDSRPQYAHYYATSTGVAYDAPDSTGARHLVYTLPIAGYPWQVVIEIPLEVVLELALSLATPLLLVMLALAGIGTLMVLVGAWQISRPLVRLATIAGEIAAGDLTMAAEVGGHDEVGRLGRSFEEMRLSLHRRLSELGLLLDVVRSVSSSRDWSFQPILRAAMSGSQAIAACVCLNDEGGGRVPVAQEGAFSGWSEILPQVFHLSREAQQKGLPLPVRSLARYLRQDSPQAFAAAVRSAVCLPLNAGDSAVGSMWVLFADRRQFDDQDLGLLSTLAAQAAVVYENARLLTEAQSGRGRLRAILASTTDPIFVADQQGRLILANPAAERVLSLKGQPPGALVSEIVPDPSMRLLLETTLETSSLTREIHLENGSTLYASVSAVALTDGGNIGRVVVMRDITELKRREHTQADFVATLSRHLRTPLAFMRAYAKMVPSVGSLNQQQGDFVDRIVGHVDQLTGMFDTLVDLNNIELGEGVKLERCSLAATIEAALALERQEIDRRQHNLRLSLPQAPVFVDGDRTLLTRAVACLVDNAAKYMPNGGTIGIQVRRQDGGAVVVVSDQGMGISGADQMRVFDRFFRAERPDVQAIAGYGLGLPTVKAVAGWHGGRVWVESKLGAGSRFHLWLPRQG